MKYNPEIHDRHSIRLKEFDYSQNGFYYVTICTRNREFYFEKYPGLKNIINKQWLNLPNRYKHIELDEYIIMPNHLHGIVIVGATFTVAKKWAGTRPAPTIGDIIGSFKSLCINEWIKFLSKHKINEIGKFWQRNYYEHIIRNEKELNAIREYIINNPIQWEFDENNPKNFKI